jgi:hypothetical protein
VDGGGPPATDAGRATAHRINVTQTYALFTSILYWTLQRIRTKDETEVDKLATSVLRKLKSQRVEDEPWSIRTRSSSNVRALDVDPFTKFAGRSADQFLIDLRNAVAHGDARTVKPFHRRIPGSAEELAGFTYECTTGTIILMESDMRRIGIGLADVFCKALRRSDEHRRDGYFERDAAQSLLEKAA